MSPVEQLNDDAISRRPADCELLGATRCHPSNLQRVRATTIVRDLAAEAMLATSAIPPMSGSAWLTAWFSIVSLSIIRKVRDLCGPAGRILVRRRLRAQDAKLANTDVIAVRPSRVALMPEATFFWLLDSSIPFNRFLLVQLNERLGSFHVRFWSMTGCSSLTPGSRRRHRGHGHPQLYPGTKRQIELSQDEIGHIVGASRQRISQALHVLEKAGLIKVDYRMITVLDLEGLRRFGD